MTVFSKCLFCISVIVSGISIPEGTAMGQSSYQDSLELELYRADSDSAKAQIYRHLIWSYIRKDPERALRHTDDYFVMAKKAGNPLWVNRTAFYYATTYRSTGQYGVAAQYIDPCISYLRTIDKPNLLAAALYQKGIIEGSMSQLEPGIKSLNEAIEIYRTLADTLNEAMTTNAKGFLFRQCHQTERALAVYQSALALCHKIGDLGGIADAYHNLGNAHRDLENYDSAHHYYNACESIKGIPYYEFGLGDIFENRGVLHARQEQFNKAIYWLKKSVDNRRKFQNYGPLIASQLSLAKCYIHLHHLDSAQGYASTALVGAKAQQMRGYLKEAHKLQADIYEKNDEKELALWSLKAYRSIHDSIFNETMASQFATIETLFQRHEKETKAAQLTRERAVAEWKIQRQSTKIAGLALGLIIISLLLRKILSLFKNARKRNKIIRKTLEQRERLVAEIHHRVKDNLHTISSLLELQSTNASDKTTQMAFVDSRARIKSMSLIHDNLYDNRNLDATGVREYVRNLCQNLFDTYNIYGHQIKLSLEINPGKLDVSVLVPVGLILNELITNALKYAFTLGREGTLAIQLKRQNEILLLSVADNGAGQMMNKDHVGFGQRLITTLARKLDAKMTISKEGGTCVSLAIAKFQSGFVS